MADISQHSAGSHAGGKVRAKKQSTKTDMTPMVDLAFLLLTFFLLTTTFNKAHVLRLTMPEAAKDSTEMPPISPANAFHLVLAEHNKLYWWIGLDHTAELTDYSSTGIRKILLERRRGNERLMVLIKPMDMARYQNIIDILDEVEIANITRYAIVDFTVDDKARIP